MRVIVLLTLVLGMIGEFVHPLSTRAPQLVAARLGDCGDRDRNGKAIAQALGYAKTGSCGQGDLSEPIPPRAAMVPGLIAYSGNERGVPNHAPLIDATLQVPGDIPFVATTGRIIGYVKVDALLVSLLTDNPVEEALALLDAGVDRNDIASLPDAANAKLVVRVRPITAAQVLKIIAIAKRYKDTNGWPLYWSMGFVADCNDAIAALGALAVNRARDHARVMATAANTQLGKVLGVVDAGANVSDALCGSDANASTHDLAVAALRPQTHAAYDMPFIPQFYATIYRTLDVAWRLRRPPNPPGTPLRRQFSARSLPRPAFVADGMQTYGDALIPNAYRPDRVRILLPQWAVAPLLKSHYAHALSWVAFGLESMHPTLDLRSADPAVLQRSIDKAKAFLAGIEPPAGQSLHLSYWYARDDCSAAVDAAIFQATRNAMGKTGGRIRYLWGRELDGSVLGEISCSYEPGPNDQWLTSSTLPTGGAESEIVAGY